MSQSAARTAAACMADAAQPFDWDAGMAKLHEAFAAYDKAEADLSAAHIDLARDMAAIIEGMGK